MTTTVGIAPTLNRLAIAPSASRHCGHVIFSETIASRHAPASRSTLTLMKTTGAPLYFVARSRRMGIVWRQGPHQDAQKSSSTTFPVSRSRSRRSPSSVTTLKPGATFSRARRGFSIIDRAEAAMGPRGSAAR
jgi:hypothetical protein